MQHTDPSHWLERLRHPEARERQMAIMELEDVAGPEAVGPLL